MLTDYHVHLRPDEPGTTADKYFTPANADRFKLVAEERGLGEFGVSEHIYRFTAALDVWQHDLWKGAAVDDIDAYVEFLASRGSVAGSRPTSSPAARTASRACWRRATLTT